MNEQLTIEQAGWSRKFRRSFIGASGVALVAVAAVASWQVAERTGGGEGGELAFVPVQTAPVDARANADYLLASLRANGITFPTSGLEAQAEAENLIASLRANGVVFSSGDSDAQADAASLVASLRYFGVALP